MEGVWKKVKTSILSDSIDFQRRKNVWYNGNRKQNKSFYNHKHCWSENILKNNKWNGVRAFIWDLYLITCALKFVQQLREWQAKKNRKIEWIPPWPKPTLHFRIKKGKDTALIKMHISKSVKPFQYR